MDFTELPSRREHAVAAPELRKPSTAAAKPGEIGVEELRTLNSLSVRKLFGGSTRPPERPPPPTNARPLSQLSKPR